MAQQTHLPAATRCSALTVSALVDPDLDRARLLATQFGVRHVGRSLSEVKGSTDAALIATPPSARIDVIAEALSLGMHVLSEKPLANTAAECDELLTLAARNPGLVTAGAHVYRFWPTRRWVRDTMLDGSLGQPLRAYVSQGNPYSWKSLSGYSMRKEMVPGGVLINAGIHPLDTLLWWFGNATCTQYLDDAVGGLESNVSARFLSEGGVDLGLRMSRTSRLRHFIAIETTTCLLELSTYARHRIDIIRCGHRKTQVIGDERDDALSPSVAQLTDFARAISSGTGPEVDFREAARAVRLVEACYRIKRTRALPQLAPIPGQVW